MYRPPFGALLLLILSPLLWIPSAHALETELYKAPLPEIPPEYWEALYRGEVVVLHEEMDDDDERTYADAVELIRIEAPVEKTMSVIEDCVNYPTFMPNIDKVTFVDAAGDFSKVMAKSWKFELSAFLFTLMYRPITLTDRKNGVIEFTLDPFAESDLTKADGHWWFYPLDNGQSTLLAFATQVESGFPLPRWLETYAVEVGYVDALTNLRWRVLGGEGWVQGDDPPKAPIIERVRP